VVAVYGMLIQISLKYFFFKETLESSYLICLEVKEIFFFFFFASLLFVASLFLVAGFRPLFRYVDRVAGDWGTEKRETEICQALQNIVKCFRPAQGTHGAGGGSNAKINRCGPMIFKS